MRLSRFILATVSMVSFLGVATAQPAQTPVKPEKPLLSNGDFESATQVKDWPDGWPRVEGSSWEEENGNHFLRLTPAKPNQMLTVYRVFDVKPTDRGFELRFRVRHNELKRGSEVWHDGRVIVDFKDAAGKKLKGGPSHPNFKGTSDGWSERVVQFRVPPGAKKLEIMPALFMVAGGTLDLDDFRLTRITDDAVLDKLGKPAEEAPPVQVRGPLPLPPALHVVGNELQTDDGKVVWLQGVNVPSLEWSNGGENVLRSIVEATENWKANAIRLPVSDDRWFGRDSGQKDGGAAYRKLVSDAVEAAATRGAYVILDLHRYRAPTADYITFWTAAASTFKDHPAVLFDLMNEPHGVSWEVWRNGGPIEEKAKDGTVQTVETVGMQKLLDAVRLVGAKNIVVVGGLDWAYDLSGILNGYALEDKTGHGIMYATHVYHWKKNWQKSFLEVAAKYPILVGECGCEVEKLSFIPAKDQEDPATWAPDMLGLIQDRKLNWTAWSFHPKASPKMLTDWSYEPTPYWGQPVKAALSGEKFKLTKLR